MSNDNNSSRGKINDGTGEDVTPSIQKVDKTDDAEQQQEKQEEEKKQEKEAKNKLVEALKQHFLKLIHPEDN